MHQHIDIQQHDNPSAEDRAYLSQQFRAFNDEQCGIFPSKELHLFVYDLDHQIIAGLVGDISWGWLHVDTLWVAQPYQQSGIETSLMDRGQKPKQVRWVCIKRI